MQRLAPLPSEEMKERISVMREEYLKDNAAPNPERLKLISIMEVANYLTSKPELFEKDLVSNSEMHKIRVTVVLFYAESVARESSLFTPRSKTYNQLLLPLLGIKDVGKVDPRFKFKLLMQLHVLLEKYRDLIHYHLVEKELDFDFVNDELKVVLSAVFSQASIFLLLKRIPTENSFDIQMKNMLGDLILKSNSKDLLFLAALSVVICDLNPKNEDTEREHYLSRTHRLKIAILIYISHYCFQKKGYLYSSPDVLALDGLALETLNVKNIDEIDTEIKKASLATLLTWLNDSNNIASSEIRINKVFSNNNKIYLDSEIRPHKEEINTLLDALQTSKVSYVTLGIATISAFTMGLTGYGLGFAIAETALMTNTAAVVKLGLGTKIPDLPFMQRAGQYTGYFAGLVFDNTATHALSLLFEALSGLIGFASGGLLSIVIYDYTPSTLLGLWELYRKLSKDSKFAKDIDPELKEWLLLCPKSIFDQENKDKLMKITSGQAFFKPFQPEFALENVQEKVEHTPRLSIGS